MQTGSELRMELCKQKHLSTGHEKGALKKAWKKVWNSDCKWLESKWKIIESETGSAHCSFKKLSY